MATHHKSQAKEKPAKQPKVDSVGQGPTTLVEQADPAVLQRAMSDPQRLRPTDVQAIQRVAGNRAVTSMLSASQPQPAVTPVRPGSVIQRWSWPWSKKKNKKTPQISAPTNFRKATTSDQLLQIIERARGDDVTLMALGKNSAFKQQLVTTLSDTVLGKVRSFFADWYQAWEHLQKLKGGSMITVDEWLFLKQWLPKKEYKMAVKEFDSFKGDPAAKEQFLKNVPQDKFHIFTDLIPKQEVKPGDKPLKEQIKSSANPKRAQQALTELKAKQAKDAKSKSRLTNAIIELLVWGVAKPRDATTDLGREGLIGIHHAVNAADALIAMKLPLYLDIVLKLALTGSDDAKSDRQVESVLILKAVAARKAKYLADDAKAKQDIGKFAEEIRGKDAEKLKKAASTRDIGGGTGLQQKFTMTCAPTSIQIVRGEADPIYAMDISAEGKHDLNYKSSVATEQKTLLGKKVVPRLVWDAWKRFKAQINGLSLSDLATVLRWQALLLYIEGKPSIEEFKNQGIALANAKGFSTNMLNEFRKYYPFPQPGLSFAEVDQLIQNNLPGVTGSTLTMERFDNGTNRIDQADLDRLWKALFRGRDIPMVVIWSGGGGHAMVFTDCQGQPPKGGASRKFLLSDPWEGTSEWLTSQQVINGTFGSFGSGYVASLNM
jgi:hypothetical protein